MPVELLVLRRRCFHRVHEEVFSFKTCGILPLRMGPSSVRETGTLSIGCEPAKQLLQPGIEHCEESPTECEARQRCSFHPCTVGKFGVQQPMGSLASFRTFHRTLAPQRDC